MARAEATRTTGLVNLVVTSGLLAGIVVVIIGSILRWIGVVRATVAVPIESRG
jgi:hypothetical protein